MHPAIALGLIALMMPAPLLSAPLLPAPLLPAPLLPAQDTKSGVEAWTRADYPAAVAIWQPLAVAGDADAQFNLAQAYRMGRGIGADVKQAEAWFRRAADQGHLRAADNLGLLLFQNGDRAGAMPLIRRSAERGEPRAGFVFATALFNGDYTEKNWPLAYAYMRRAADAGVPQAQTSLGQMVPLLSAEDREAGLKLARTLPRLEPAPPAPPAPPVAPSSPKTRDGLEWQVQLGAFKERAGAEKLWYGAASHAPALVGLRPDFAFDGKLTRLRTGPFPSQTEAARACTFLRRDGIACVAVPPQP